MCVNPKVMYFNRFLVSDKCKGTIILERTTDNVSYVKDLVKTFGGVGSFIQCGQCIECKSKKALEWSIRCLCEYETNKDTCYFLTLTYDDNHLKSDNLNPHDLRLFIDNLYNHGYRFKYYACGEYGSETLRPHYHMIVWLDNKITDLVKYDDKYFTSDTLDKIWCNRGSIKIGLADIGSIFYVAGYVSKKLNKIVDSNKVCEFQRFSKGIGYDYFSQNYQSMLENDKVYICGKSYGLPRYFSKLLKSRFPEEYSKMNKIRFDSNFNDFNYCGKTDSKLHLSLKQREILLKEYQKHTKQRDL